jgi:antirestriction protein
MTIKQKFSSIDQSKLTADQKAFLTKIKDVTKNFTDKEMNKKVEAPLDGFIEKAKEKMPEAIKSAPAKRTSKSKPSQTRKPKRTAMSLAKEIRKEGETWNEARARASKMMKEDSKDLSKTVETELEKLSKLVKSAKTRSKLSGISDTDIKRDSVRKAKPRGRRISKEGNVYYENRENRTDRLSPNYPKNAPLLENGAYLTDPNFGNFQSQTLATGGSVTNERKHVNHDEDYEIRYAKPRPSRKGYKGVRAFDNGGAVTNERKHVNHNEDYEIRYAKPRPSRTGYKGKRSFADGGNVAGYDLAGHLGGNFNVAQNDGVLSGVTGTQYSGLVGETGAMSSGEMFARGGGVRKVGNREYSYGRNWTNDHKHVNKSEEHEVKYNRKGKFLGIFNNGGSVTNERKHVNHDEDYEVRYAKPRPNRKGYKGARKFMAGGMNDNSPKIYVADLEAYNSGRLVGEWLDLSDYNDADELNDAIQDLLDGWGKEEYAIHDYENLPSGMYSEYMGARDFAELYEMMDLAKENNLPLEVVQEVVSQYGEGAVDEFMGKYDSVVDFAEQLVDDLGGLENFSSPEYYTYITNTDRRLIAGEEADNAVENARDNDEFDDMSEDEQREAEEKLRDEVYDEWYDGLDDPYTFLVEEQGLYGMEDFFKASFISVDYEKLSRDLEQDYTFAQHDGEVYVFNIR